MSATIAEEVKAVRVAHPSWSFEESWNHVMAAQPWRSAKSAEANRVLAKHQPEKEREKRENYLRLEAVAEHLLRKNPRMTMSEALEIARVGLPSARAWVRDLLATK